MGALNVLDIIIIAIMLIFSIAGFAKGFLSSLLQLVGSVASLAIAVWLAKPLASFISSIADVAGWFGDKIAALLVDADPLFGWAVGDAELIGLDPLVALDNAKIEALINGSELSLVFKKAILALVPDGSNIAVGTGIGEWFGMHCTTCVSCYCNLLKYKNCSWYFK